MIWIFNISSLSALAASRNNNNTICRSFIWILLRQFFDFRVIPFVLSMCIKCFIKEVAVTLVSLVGLVYAAAVFWCCVTPATISNINLRISHGISIRIFNLTSLKLSHISTILSKSYKTGKWCSRIHVGISGLRFSKETFSVHLGLASWKLNIFALLKFVTVYWILRFFINHIQPIYICILQLNIRIPSGCCFKNL